MAISMSTYWLATSLLPRKGKQMGHQYMLLKLIRENLSLYISNGIQQHEAQTITRQCGHITKPNIYLNEIKESKFLLDPMSTSAGPADIWGMFSYSVKQ